MTSLPQKRLPLGFLKAQAQQRMFIREHLDRTETALRQDTRYPQSAIVLDILQSIRMQLAANRFLSQKQFKWFLTVVALLCECGQPATHRVGMKGWCAKHFNQSIHSRQERAVKPLDLLQTEKEHDLTEVDRVRKRVTRHKQAHRRVNGGAY